MSGWESWDWSLWIFDHVDLYAADYAESVRFYEAVLAPLGIAKLSQDEESAAMPRATTRPTARPDGNNVEALYRDVGNRGHGESPRLR